MHPGARIVAIAGAAVLLLAIIFNPPPPSVGAVVELGAQGPVTPQVSIMQGQTVVFTNTDTKAHWPAANSHPTHSLYPGSDARKCDSTERPLLFDVCEPLAPNESYSFRFTSPGEWRYHDHLAPQFEGTVIVHPVEGYREPLSYSVDAFMRKIPTHVSNLISSSAGQVLGLWHRINGTLPPAPLYGPYGSEDLVSLRDYAQVKVLSLIGDDREVLRMIHQLGVKEVLRKIEEEVGGESNPKCHMGAHVVGQQAFNLYGVEGLGSCTLACHAGCYHGAMEEIAMVSDSHSLFSDVNTLCSSFDTIFGRYQCFHGIGHGFLLYVASDVPKALDACRSLGTSDARDACFGGVFMENIFGDGLTSNTSAPWAPNTTDLHFPCSVLEGDTNTIRWCYELQSEYILLALKNDYARAAEECLAAPSTVTDVCFKSLGRLYAAQQYNNPQGLEATCRTMPEEYVDDCILGGSKYAIDFPGPDREGGAVSYCGGLPSADAKRVCYGRYIESVTEMFSDTDTRLQVCSLLETPYDAECKSRQENL